MFLSKRSQYAFLALVELGKKDRGKGDSVREKAYHEHNYLSINNLLKALANEDISAKFLEQILGELTKSNILISKRGASGGYCLAKNPEEISLRQIIHAVGDHYPPKDVIFFQKKSASHSLGLKSVFNKIFSQTDKFLREIKLADILWHDENLASWRYEI